MWEELSEEAQVKPYWDKWADAGLDDFAIAVRSMALGTALSCDDVASGCGGGNGGAETVWQVWFDINVLTPPPSFLSCLL